MDYQPTLGSKTSFNDVKGLDDVIVELQQIVHYFQNPEVRLCEFFMINPSTLRLFLSFPRKIHVGILCFQLPHYICIVATVFLFSNIIMYKVLCILLCLHLLVY